MIPFQRHLKCIAFLLGVHATVSQVVLMREFFLLFDGNNLSSGLFLGYWLSIVALGARWGGTCKLFAPKRINTLVLLMAVGPLLSSLLMAVAQKWSNQSLTLLNMAMAGLAIIPPAFIGGITFSWLAGALSVSGNIKPIGSAYIYEQMGSAAIGLALYVWMLTSLDAFQITTIFALLVAGYFLLSQPFNILLKTQMGLAFLFLAMAMLCLPIYSIIRNWVFTAPNAKIVQITDTPYGQIWRVDSLKTTHWYENGRRIAQEQNIISTIDSLGSIHQSFLFLSHGFPLPENGKAKSYTFNKSLAYVLKRPNAESFLMTTTNQYHCILVSTHWGQSYNSNHYYNDWFIGLAASKLKPDGSLYVKTNQLNQQQTQLIILKLQSFFGDVNAHPAQSLISCSNPLHNKATNIGTRSTSLTSTFSPNSFSMKQTFALGFAMIMGIGLFAFFATRKSKVVFLTGISTSALQVGLWHAMQTLSGFAYNYTGLAIVCFMAMLSLGAYTSQRTIKMGPQKQIIAALLCLSLIVMGVIAASITITGQNISGLWVMLPVAASGFAAGYLFAAISTSRPFNNRLLAGDLYAMDLLGGAIGAFAMGLVFIPTFGLVAGNLFALTASLLALVIAIAPSKTS